MVDVGTEPHYPCTTLHRMIATVINLRSEKTNAHSDSSRSVAFSPDGKTIVSGSFDKTIKVWKSGAIWLKITSLGPKLTRPAFLGRHTRAGEREGQRPQRLGHVCPVLAKWIANCLRIARQDDQSLGFRCEIGPKTAPPWPKLTPAGSPGSYAGSQDRESESA